MKKIGMIVQQLLDGICERADQFHSKTLERFWNAFWNLLILEGNGIPYHYTESILTSHLKGCAGSEFATDSVDALRHLLFADYGKEWEEFTPDEGCAIPGCTYFRVFIHTVVGANGAIPITSLSNNETLLVQVNHANKYEVHFKTSYKIPTHWVTLILGKEGEKEIVFTMHPGLPMPAADIPASGIIPEHITVSEAKKMGFKTVKLTIEK